jgi:hypothetical protein
MLEFWKSPAAVIIIDKSLVISSTEKYSGVRGLLPHPLPEVLTFNLFSPKGVQGVLPPAD